MDITKHDNKCKNKPASKTFFISTHGCQMNQEDSEKIAGMLREMGYEKSDTRNDSDVIIFNTCCVRENPENKVYGNLGALKALKAKKPGLIIGVCGCMMQEEGIAQNIKKKYPHVDLIFGTHNLHRFPELFNNVLQSNSTVLEVWEKEGEIVEGVPIRRESDLQAYVTIMYGCNNFCTYCIVPYTRGRERSRSPKDIVNEIKDLADSGYKEIILLGQNVNSYGKDLEDMSFDKLLRLINEIPGIEYIRFMTSHPKDLSEDVILAIKECDKVCEHIHLPIQSGSTRILNKMNRKYTKEDYLILVDKIKNHIPNVAITTDFIVGFPGENDEDFEETLDLVSKIEFDSAYTFLYSIRKGTPAAEYENQVPEDVKHDRFNKLTKLLTSMSEKNNSKYLGKVVEVLVDGTKKTDESMLSGRTRTSKLVYFNGKESEYYGKLVKVKITETHAFILIGEIVQ